ncbi:MAG: tRNA (adenosine(37)-N6)-threonylcarbamoyltransferase complex ATPase subunit type 1 TsaE [Spirochaetota bacterium]|nr:tRNA (adenosine(37)-N6)-threonylcarbamoyltransferase complex ATPase subunit type 1 TsaE [Spirochaetota bacterium]
MKKIIITNSVEETLQWGEELGKSSIMGDVFALNGELGVGKTVVAKGIAKGLGINEEITSPSFVLLEIYPNKLPLYHFDLYRIDSEIEFDRLNFEEYWRGDGISVIEWAEKADIRLPENSIKIKIEWLDSDKRRIEIEYPDN